MPCPSLPPALVMRTSVRFEAATGAEAPTTNVVGDARLRLFVAIELSDAWRHSLNNIAAGLRASSGDAYRWVRPDLLHLTLVFLGWQPAGALTKIEEAIDAAAGGRPAFSLVQGQVGGFGGRRVRVIWVAANDPAGALQPLRAALERELDAREIGYDRKPLVGHITLARARETAASRPATPFGPQAGGRRRAPPLTVRDIVLMRSELGRGGPRYTVLARASLGERC